MMADIALPTRARAQSRESTAWDRLKVNRNWLGFWFMLPAMAFLILFLAYPLGLGIWISFTDAKIGRPGEWIGLENYDWLKDDAIFWLSVTNTLLYTLVASAIADFVLLDMFASYCTGREDAKGVIKIAERQLRRIYR